MTASSPPPATADASALKKPSTVCHWIPCNVDYDGMAPVHMYFAPQPLSNDNDEIQAAQFRGRGLISVRQDTVQGAILSFTSEGTVQQQASFGGIREWHHEHTVAAAQRATSQVQRAQEWYQVARAAHDPIPVDEGSMEKSCV